MYSSSYLVDLKSNAKWLRFDPTVWIYIVLSFLSFDVKYVKCVKHVMPTNVFSMTEREILSQRNMTIFFLFTSENISYLKQKRTYLPKIIWFSFLSLHQAFQYFQNISISSFFFAISYRFLSKFPYYFYPKPLVLSKYHNC